MDTECGTIIFYSDAHYENIYLRRIANLLIIQVALNNQQQITVIDSRRWTQILIREGLYCSKGHKGALSD